MSAGIGRALVAGMSFGMGNMLGNRLNDIVSTAVNPLMLYPKHAMQYQLQTSMPGIDVGVQAYVNGTLDKKTFDFLCAVNNQPVSAEGSNNHQKLSVKVHNHYINSLLPRLNLEQLIYCQISGIITDEQFKNWSARFKVVDGQLQPLVDMIYSKFDMGIILSNYYRGTWKKPETAKRIQRLVGCNNGHANRIIENSAYLPPPSDLIRMSVRDAFTNNVKLREELDEEYDEQKDIIPWAKAQGILTDAEIMTDEGKKTLDVLRMYWRSHWQLMSPTQGYEGLHRLRNEDRVKRYPLVKDLEPFTFPKLEQLLKMSDYLPSQRKVLAAISYKIIGRVDLRRLYNDEVIDIKEVKEQVLDQGYNEEDAKLLTKWTEKQKEDKDKKEKERKDKEKFGKITEETYKGYNIGAYSRQEAYNGLIAYGVDTDIASWRLNAIDFAINRKRVETLIQMIKGEFFLGLYDGLQAYAELVQGGLTDIRANQYVIRWQRQLSRPRRLVSINTIIDWLKRGLISFIDSKKRLVNLGLSNEDTLLYVEMAKMDIQKAINLEEAKRAKTQQQLADEAKRLEKEARAAKKSSISDLKAYSSISQIGKWIQSGLLDINDAIERMRFMEVPETDIQRYLTEWGT